MDVNNKTPFFLVCIFVIADFDIGIVHFFKDAVKFDHQETQNINRNYSEAYKEWRKSIWNS